MRVLTLVALLVAPTLQPSDAPIDPLIDEPAIDFEAATLDGGAVRLSDLSGQVVLVNFWGIWCTSCRQEIPELVELDRELRDRGLVVLGADYGDQPEAIPAFAERFGMTYPILLDDALAETYEVVVFPTTLVIDRAGRLRYRVEGYRPEAFAAMRGVLEGLLDAP